MMKEQTPCSDLQQYRRAILRALLSTGDVSGCGVVVCIISVTSVACVETSFVRTGSVVVGGGGLADCAASLAPDAAPSLVFADASGRDREKEEDAKTI